MRLRRVGAMLRTEASAFVSTRVAVVVLLVITASVLTALSPVLLKCIVDELTGHGDRQSPTIPALVMLYVLALWLSRTANEIRGVVFARLEQRVCRTISERLFAHLMCLPLRFHLNRQTGAVSQVLNNGLDGLRIVLRHLVFTLLPVAVELGTVVLVLGHLVTAQFIAMFGAAIMGYFGALIYSATTIAKVARSASTARIDATAAMTDGLLNYETVKCFTAEALVQSRVETALRRSESEWVQFYRRYAINGLLVGGVFASFLAGIVFCASEDVLRGGMSLGNFILINTYMIQIVRPIEMLGYAMQGVSQGVAMLDDLTQVLLEPTENLSAPSAVRKAGPGQLEFHDVSVSYGSGRKALTGLSLCITAGHTLGIVGASGSGKSTIVRLLMRLLEPDKGSILLDGEPICGMRIQDLRRAVAVVPQDTTLFDETLRYNIAFGRADASADEIEAAARIAQLHELVMAWPDGYDTRVGERGVKLSGGERQRVSIARAILKGPKIYVFDEATSSLDSRTERDILHNLYQVSSANTTLVIAHRLSMVVHADEIVVLESGEVIERGTHHSLLRANGAYAGLWKSQRGGVATA